MTANSNRLREALRAFVNVRDQFPESVKLIRPKLNGLTPITVTVTKDQFREGVEALAEADRAAVDATTNEKASPHGNH